MASSTPPAGVATLVELLEDRARTTPDAVAYTFLLDFEAGQVELSFGALARRARDIAARLQAAGAAGERVLLLYPPGLDYIAGFFGCLYAGAVAVPVYPPRLDRPLHRFLSVLADAEPTFALSTTAVMSLAEGLLAEHRQLAWLATDELDDSGAASWVAPAIGPRSLAFLQYTSGSTADPKGVMVSHENLLGNQSLIQRAFGTGPESKVVGWLPLYHDMGLIGNVLHPLFLGTSCVLLSPLEFLREPRRWLQAISDFGGTVSGGPNFAFDLCVRKIAPEERAKLDLSRWTVAFNGAEPVRHQTLARFAEAFGPSGFRADAFVPCYGLAEATLLVTGGRPRQRTRWFDVAQLEQKRAVEVEAGAPGGRPLVSCGPAWDLRIVDPATATPLEEGALGEIWVANASVAQGYFRRPDVSVELFGARTGDGQGPSLRTGDLGFVHHEELFVAGRLKDLIIIRGRNHAPQDLELTAEGSHPALRPGCGAAFSVDEAGEERLVIVQEIASADAAVAGAAREAIREAVTRVHELQVHAVALVAPRSIPKTSSGKIQRRACQAAYLAGTLELVEASAPATERPLAAGAEPTGERAEWLARALASRAGIPRERLDLDAPVASLGLDSLAVVELTHELERASGVRLPIEAFFSRVTVRELAERTGAAAEAPRPTAPPPAGAERPLSSGQKALWLLQALDPASSVYHVPAALELTGALDVTALRAAFVELLERHALLRSHFLEVAGVPVQRVGSAEALSFVVEAPADEAALRRRLEEEAHRPFSLETELPVRVHLFRRAPSTHVLLVTVHHLVTDFWSQGLLLDELTQLYAARRRGRPARLAAVTSRFEDFVALQRTELEGPEGARLTRYWLEVLSGELPVLELPSAPRPAVQSFRGAVETFTLDASLTSALRRFCQAHEASPFMVLLAAYQALLHRTTGQEDLVVGTVATGRGAAAFARTPGYFVNPVALRSRPTGARRFDELLAETKRAALGALEHQGLPFATLVEQLKPRRDSSRSPVFQTMFVFQRGLGAEGEHLTALAMNLSGASFELDELRATSVPLAQTTAQFDLSLTAGIVGGRIHATFDYCVELFEPRAIQAFARHFETLLAGALSDPSLPLASLPLWSAQELAALDRWNDTARPFPPHATVSEWVSCRAALSPDAVALIHGARAVTYAELERRAARVAAQLEKLGARREIVVGVCLERGVELVVATLGILKAGAAYLPLDPETPAERALATLRASAVEVVVSEPELAARFAPLTTRTVESLEVGATDAKPTHRPAAFDLACVIATSGSTGAPKSVMLEHRALVNLVASFEECYEPTAADRLLPITSVASASFVGELFPLLCTGGALVLPSREEMLDEAALAALLRRRAVTMLSTLPSRLASLADAASSLAQVRLILSGGEALTSGDRALLSSGAALFNGYGLTEAGVCSTYHRVLADELAAGRTVPLGRPLRNTRLYVLDAALAPVPPGSRGELYVAGAGLARGYHLRPGATAERFLPDPFHPGERMYRTGDLARWDENGTLSFLGRSDDQVKIRGHRIELAELEATLRSHPQVLDAVASVRGEGIAGRRLVAHLVARSPEAPPTPGALLAHVREKLPEAMVPAAFMVLPALPLTAAGKIDRRALPEPPTVRPELASSFQAPEGGLEGRIAGVWRAHLGIEQVGIDDNFFDLGGHSLLLAKVHAALKEALGLPELTLVELFRFPTVASLAAHLGSSSAPTPTPAPPRRAAPRADEPIAIIGLAGRFPGAASPEALWKNLAAGVESISFFTDEELLAQGVAPSLLANPSYVKAGGVLEGIDAFDASFFGLSPRETELMDPQHRVFLECAWEGLERAGYDTARFAGRVGVFAGCSMNTYLIMNLLSHLELVASIDTLQASLGNDKDPLTSRVSYKLNLKGPSITIQSASSTSLVAVHVACEALRAGTCEMALAGGVSIHLPEKSGYLFQEGGTTARDGHCRAFDAQATGFVSGKGAGVVVLKPLASALADGDHIHAVIRGSACNNDGSLKVSYTAPSVEGQVDVYRQALAAARVEPEDISYIECHGTGTAMGDPIEVAALAQVYGERPRPPGSVALGALKTNIGHLDNAAGVCGLIKATLSVERATLVPTLHYQTPNPQIDFARTPFEVNTTLRQWPASPRLAGVTSLGMGGTNAHVILAEAPHREPSGPSRPDQLLVLSAKTETALEAMARALAAHLAAHPEQPLADVAFTLQAGRRAFRHRRAVVAASATEAIAALEAPPAVPAHPAPERPPKVAFLFTGQGAQYVNMARGLYESEPVFRDQVDHASRLLEPELGFALTSVLYPPPGAELAHASASLGQTAVTQPALFVVEHALAHLLLSWGIEPDALLGHSVGELVAACVAGVLSLPDALKVVAARGRAMQAMAPGRMLAVPLSANELADGLPEGVTVAAINEPGSCVASGPIEAIAQLEQHLAARGLEGRRLETSHAFHSSMMDGARGPLADCLARVKLSPPTRRFLSNLTGTWVTDAQAVDPSYWVEQMRQAVQFAPAVGELLTEPGRVFVELGPGTLSGMVRRHPARDGHEVLSALRHPAEAVDDQRFLVRALGRLWTAGVSLEARAFFGAQTRRRVPLPTYPFERQRYWVDPKPRASPAPTSAVGRLESGDWYSTPAWRQAPRARDVRPPAPMVTWIVADEPAAHAALARALTARGQSVVELRRAPAGFRRSSPTIVELQPTDAAAWRQAFDELSFPGRVVWLSTGSRADPLQGLEHDYFGPVAMVQGWGRSAAQGPFELAFVSTGLHDVTGEEPLEPARAALLGPARVIPLEHPSVVCRSIDLLAFDEPSLGSLLDELLTPDGEREVALRRGRRWVPGVAPLRLPGPPPLRDEGVYLITGGLGELGLAFADALVRSVRARLVLLARGPLPPRSEWPALARGAGPLAARWRKVLALETAGRVELVTGDVAVEADVRAAVALALERHGALHGVIHAAGAAGGGLLQLRERAASQAVFHGKLLGALTLEGVLGDRPLDFVALCSSLTAIVAMPGQGDYVAANAGLDALASRAARRGAPWLSINWDAWREVGMAARLEAPDELAPWRAELLRDGLSTSEGVAALERALGSGLSRVIVSTHPVAERLAEPRALDRAAARPEARVPSAPMATGEELEQRIGALWKELLGVHHVGIDDNFFELGGSSLIGIKLLGRLRSELAVELSEVTLFQAPTVRTIAALIRAAQAPAEPTPEAPTSAARERGQRRRERRLGRRGDDS